MIKLSMIKAAISNFLTLASSSVTFSGRLAGSAMARLLLGGFIFLSVERRQCLKNFLKGRAPVRSPCRIMGFLFGQDFDKI
jgi:hypothetical protein